MNKIGAKRAICMWCHSHCSVVVYVKNGRLVKIEEDKEHPRSTIYKLSVRGCPRIHAAEEWFYHPDRLKYPLKRLGERGGGKWQVIPWEQALDEIAQKLASIKKNYGPEAVATFGGTGRTTEEYRDKFFSLFGSPNFVTQGHICWGLNNVVSNLVTGMTFNKILSPVPGVTKSLFLIGTNPAVAERATWYGILNAKKAGAFLIVVDPRYSETAQWADLWLQLRPGTDCALLMGMINVIISEELYDREFVEKWCHGFDKLAERAREYPLEKVADITWVPAEKIAQAARMYATNKPAWSSSYMGIELLANSVEVLHARYILPAITGNLDVKGGEGGSPPTPQYISEAEVAHGNTLPPKQKNKQLGADRFKLMSWNGYDLIQENVERIWGRRIAPGHHVNAHAPSIFRAILTGKPYPVKAAISLASNTLMAYPNAKLIYKALKRLDLYVVMDFWLTPSAELAGFVFPCASWLERPHLNSAEDTRSTITCGETAIPPVKEGEYERRTDYDFWRGLGIRLGQEDYWPAKTLEEEWSYRLAPLGFTFEEFMGKQKGFIQFPVEYQRYEKVGFATATGKVELYSTILDRMGYDPLPCYYEPPESLISTPELAKEYPLVLITGGRFQPMYHTEFRQIDSLRRKHPDPLTQINPQKAAELGIEEGDWIWIETPRGRVRQRCQYFEGIDPRVVHAQHGWWFPELPGEEPWLYGAWESSINVVCADDPEQCNRISGGWPCRALLCKVYGAKNYCKTKSRP